MALSGLVWCQSGEAEFLPAGPRNDWGVGIRRDSGQGDMMEDWGGDEELIDTGKAHPSLSLDVITWNCHHLPGQRKKLAKKDKQHTGVMGESQETPRAFTTLLNH